MDGDFLPIATATFLFPERGCHHLHSLGRVWQQQPYAITQLAENGTSDSTIVAIAGHVSRRMLERYSHVRDGSEAQALEALALDSKTADYETSHDTNPTVVTTVPV